jgi:hypothetical protein
MSSIIYVFDQRTAQCFAWNNGKFATKPGEETCPMLIVSEQEWVGETVEKIYNKAADGELSILRIMAHGSREFPKVVLGRDGIKSSTVFKFKKLADRFAKNARIELHSCSVLNPNNTSTPGKTIAQAFSDAVSGNSPSDDDMLKKKVTDPLTGLVVTAADWCQKLADFTGADVIAAEKPQFADKNWAFEGPIQTFRSVLVTMKEDYERKYGTAAP